MALGTFDKYPNKEYLFVAGTSEAHHEDYEIHVFQVKERKIELVDTFQMEEPIFYMKAINNMVVVSTAESVKIIIYSGNI